MQHILAIDQGTTGTTVLVLDEALSVKGRGYQEFAQHYPAPGHVEHDPQEILASVRAAITAAIAQSGVAPTELAAVGITNQRETVVVWDRATGEPVHRAIVWQDRRTADACGRLIDDGHEDAVRQATGLPIDPYFSATKLAWILDQGDLRARAERGELAFGTVDAFLVHALAPRPSFGDSPPLLGTHSAAPSPLHDPGAPRALGPERLVLTCCTPA